MRDDLFGCPDSMASQNCEKAGGRCAADKPFCFSSLLSRPSLPLSRANPIILLHAHDPHWTSKLHRPRPNKNIDRRKTKKTADGGLQTQLYIRLTSLHRFPCTQTRQRLNSQNGEASLLWFALLCASLAFATRAAGLQLKLTHVDAREGCTDEERMRRATERTHRRDLASTKPARLYENQYIVDYLIGNPPQKAEALLDTATNLVWKQCAACSVCFRQDLPLYDPSASRSARNLTCGDAACAAGVAADVAECGQGVNAGACFVRVLYNAFHKIAGDLSSDEFTFGAEKVTLAFGSIGAADLTTGNLFGALVDDAFQPLMAELERQLGAAVVRPPKTVLGKRVELCVAQADFPKIVPPLVLHFGGAGDVVLPPENYWAPVGDDTACMAVFSSARKISAPMNETTVIGSFMQQNMQVLYDLGKDMISFQPTDCSNFQPAPLGRLEEGIVKMASSSLFCLVLVLCTSLTFAAGIRLALTHVDAKEKGTVEERMRRAADRTHRRLVSMATAPVRWAETQYIAEYLIGTPPQRAEAIVDTGSNLVWTQCATCRNGGAGSCFAQTLPLYDPSLSDTATALPCNATACALGPESYCAGRNRTKCGVRTAYAVGPVLGVLGVESFTFGSSSENATLAFGCVTANKLAPGSLGGASGVLGLGRGARLGATNFCYCLTPYFRDNVTTSHLFVGASAPGAGNASSSPITSVPFVKSPDGYPFSSYYYVPLSGISVGNSTLDVPAAAFELRLVAPGSWTGTLVDSGSPFTAPRRRRVPALRHGAGAADRRASLVPAPADVLDLCVARGDVAKLVPPMVLHFGGGGGDVVVPPENYWAPWDAATACMVVFSSAAGPNATLPMNETTVIGNYMQQDMHMLYDLGNGVLSFQQADCSSV
ncbi:hypothetical protein EJB05_00999, partial [Eragrostis curvula]